MSVDQILSHIRQRGIRLTPDGDRIKYKAPSGAMTPELADSIRTHRQEIIRILNQDSKIESAILLESHARANDTVDTFMAGDCEKCPAAGYWDWYGPGKWCFHTAYFLGKSGRPVLCDDARDRCPLM